LGGRVPARLQFPAAVQRAAAEACELVVGLKGYVGVDLIVPEGAPDLPVVVEINPRLTTSYSGYSALASENPAARLLFPERAEQKIAWRTGAVLYEPDGAMRHLL